MRFTKVLGYEQESTCDVSGKKGACFIISIDDGQEQRVHQTRMIELLRFLFNTNSKSNSRTAEAVSASKG